MVNPLPFTSTSASLSFPSLISGVLNSLEEAAAGVLSPAFPLLHRLKLLLLHLHKINPPAPQSIRQALDSLHANLQQSFVLVKKPTGPSVSTLELIEEAVRGIGRCLGMLLLAWTDGREEMGMLQREMMCFKIDLRSGEIVEDVEDLVMRVKRGEEEVLRGALEAVEVMIRGGFVGEGEREGLVEALVNRLGTARNGCRLRILVLLKRLADVDDECKVVSFF